MERIDILGCCTPAYPTVYTNALSYMEALCQLQGAINTVIDVVNTYTPVNEDYVRDYITNALSGIDTEINNFKNSVNAQLTESEQNYATFTLQITQQVADILDDVKQLNTEFYYAMVTWFKSEVDKIINKLDDNTIITNPVYNKLDSLKNTLNDLYTGIIQNGLSAYQYSQLNLTANQYDCSFTTAFKYDCSGKNVFHEYLYAVFSGFTGLKTTIQDAIAEIIQYLDKATSKTASDYDALALTASVYDGKAITAYNYNWGNALN